MAAHRNNRYAEGLTNSGKPPIWDDPKKFDKRVNEYFEYIKGEFKDIPKKGKEEAHTTCLRAPEPPLITGLALFMGFSTKTTLYEYAKRKEYANSIKRGLMLVENNYEKYLFEKNSTGAIFALKNMDWRDQRHHDHTTKGKELTQNVDLSKLDEATLLKLMEAKGKKDKGDSK